MIIAVPKEIMHDEGRVAVTPETAGKLTRMGFGVLVEKDAGAEANLNDEDYRHAGAEIVGDVRDLYAAADIVLKVKQPLFNSLTGRHEVEMMRPGTLLIAFLHPAAPRNHLLVGKLRAGKITALSMDAVPRVLSHVQPMDALTSMSTVTGYRSVLLGAVQLARFVPLMGTAIGTMPPAKFLMLGAGVVGLQAIATARRLGGLAMAFDIRAEAREQARSLGAEVRGFEAPDDLVIGEGGYARQLPENWLEKERQVLATVVSEADVIISSALVPGETAPVLLTAEIVRRLRPGSVIIDVAIDQGGNCALTKPGEETVVDGVTICGFENIPGGMPEHATWLYANNLLEFVRNLFNGRAGKPDLTSLIARNCLITHAGSIVHEGTLRAMAARETAAHS
jgi:H+-translocating NAD(P) transhydrogenase subunit alpha